MFKLTAIRYGAVIYAVDDLEEGSAAKCFVSLCIPFVPICDWEDDGFKLVKINEDCIYAAYEATVKEYNQLPLRLRIAYSEDDFNTAIDFMKRCYEWGAFVVLS